MDCDSFPWQGRSYIRSSPIYKIKMENILTVVDGQYPFGLSTAPALVQEVQTFSSLEAQKEKKRELLKKSEMVHHAAVIKIEAVLEGDRQLTYRYEWVPHSLETYLRSKRQDECESVWSMTKTLLSKKVNFELTMLTSYLAKMRIQTELAFRNLGLSHEEKLKLYVSPRSKMGIKSEIQLLLIYSSRKEAIIQQLHTLFTQLDNPSQIPTRPQQPFMPAKQSQPSKLRQTRTFQESNEFRKRKMSSEQFDLGNKSELPRAERSSKKEHKYSFQGPNPSNFQKGRQRDRHSFGNYQTEGAPQSKSIKIELEQTQNYDQSRQRKDSYKLKITTFREYELEGNPGEMFGGQATNDADIFDYFANKAKKEEEFMNNQNEEQEEEEANFQNDKFRKETGETLYTNPEPPSPVSPYSLQDSSRKHRKSSRNLDLEQRIREAKERTSKALNLIKALKK